MSTDGVRERRGFFGMHAVGGLRRRVTIIFALGGLLLVAVVASATYFLAQRYLLSQRERVALRQVFIDAGFVRDRLESDPNHRDRALDQLVLSQRAEAALSFGGHWDATTADLRPDDIPGALRRLVASGKTAHQRITYDGRPYMVAGVPLTGTGGHFYELRSLTELESTLEVIRNSLFAAALVATIAAGLLGHWAAKRALRPLEIVSTAAGRMAEGDLGTRMTPQSDRDLDRVAHSFNAMADALEARIERDERFVSDVTHELRSPLTTLAAASDVLRARADMVPDPARTAIELMVSEIDRLRAMVEELLELSRAQAGADPLRLEPILLGELALNIVTRIRDGDSLVDVDRDLDANAMLLDKRRIERILVNLIANAEQHGQGLTALRAKRVDAAVWIAVDDAGPGIEPEERERIFERFARGTRAGQRGSDGGTGLGLALVAEHVRVHGGTVRAETGPGGVGTRIVLELPYHQA